MEFKEAVKFVILDEGGYVNHKNDKGGETNFGISKRSYPGLDIKNLTVEEATRIYKEDFWVHSSVEKIPYELRYQFFDMCVNHGANRATKILQSAVRVTEDGVIGAKTIEKLKGLDNISVAQERMEFFIRIVKSNPSQIAFLEGWGNRCFKVLKRCVK